MEMEVNGIERNVIDVQIVYSNIGVLDKYWYFIQVKYNHACYMYDWEIIEAYEKPEEAVKRFKEIKVSIDAVNH